MTKLTKRVLFYSAIAVFLASSYIIILYAQGFKYSFADNRFYRTGAIYLKANTGADIYMNEKLIGSTSFFNDSYRIEGLIPNTYSVRVQKNGHTVWQKVITVDEGFVSEFSKILLISEKENLSETKLEELNKEINSAFATLSLSVTASQSNLFVLEKDVLLKKTSNDSEDESEKISDNVKGFTLSKDKNKLLWWTANEIWVIWLNDANYQPYHKKGDRELITRFSTQIKKVAWFNGEDHLIVDLGQVPSASLGQAIYRILEIDTRGGINIVEF